MADGAWPPLRATLIGVVVLAQLIDALPLPELREDHFDNPVAHDELEGWAEALQGAGLDVSPDALREFGLGLGRGSVAFRKLLLRPWFPLRQLTGTGQSWGLFAYPDPYAGRLVVEGRTGEAWAELYRAPDGGEGSLAARLDYRRTRGVYDDACDRPKPRKIYSRFARWVAEEAFALDPALDEVEVRLDLVHILPPAQRAREKPEKRRHALRVGRDLRVEEAP